MSPDVPGGNSSTKGCATTTISAPSGKHRSKQPIWYWGRDVSNGDVWKAWVSENHAQQPLEVIAVIKLRLGGGDGLRLEYIQDTVKRQAIVDILVASSDDEPSVESDVETMNAFCRERERV